MINLQIDDSPVTLQEVLVRTQVALSLLTDLSAVHTVESVWELVEIFAPANRPARCFRGNPTIRYAELDRLED